MSDCINNYDDKITVVPKPSTPVFTITAKPENTEYTKTAKPYSIEPNGLVTEDCNAILNEDGTQLLMQVG